jgi:hypothetical protein
VARRLGSDDAAVSDAAYAVLTEQLDRWRLLPNRDSGSRAIHLATVIAESGPPGSVGADRRRTELGMQLLLWPAAEASQAHELASICERILATRGPRQERPAAPATASGVNLNEPSVSDLWRR